MRPLCLTGWLAGAQEAERGEFDVMAADMRTGQLVVNEPRVKVDLKQYTERHVFNFDAVLDENVDNDAVYRCIPFQVCAWECSSTQLTSK